MGAGKLDTRVTLQRPTSARNAKGEAVLTYTDLPPVWAGFEAYRSTEIINAFRDAGYRAVRMVIRYRTDITQDWRVVSEGHTYEVVGWGEVAGGKSRREYMNVELREIT